MPTTLVAVNGLGGVANHWYRFEAALSTDFRLRVVDLLGHGDRPPATDYRYGALVKDVAGCTAELPPFPLIGFSVGGAVAWLFTARHRGRVTHLVLLDPAAPHQSRFREGPTPEAVHVYTYASPAQAVDALRGIDPTVTEEDVTAAYRQNADGRWEPRYDAAILPALVEEARHHGDEFFSELENVRVPTLLLHGENSFLGAAQIAEIASALPEVLVEQVPGAGHFMVRERPQYLADRIAAFVRDVGPR